jgi:hypothetical protein
MTKDDILMMARNSYGIYAFTAEDLSKFVELIARKEREACVKICEDHVKDMDREYKELGEEIAGTIQARGEK